jgi:hypothetical protein
VTSASDLLGRILPPILSKLIQGLRIDPLWVQPWHSVEPGISRLIDSAEFRVDGRKGSVGILRLFLRRGCLRLTASVDFIPVRHKLVDIIRANFQGDL